MAACDSGTSPVAPGTTIFTISADPPKIRPGETSEIRVVALHKSGVPARTGTEIRFSTNLGTIEPEVARTDRDGVALAKLTAGGRTGDATVTASSGAQNVGTVKVVIAVPSITADFSSTAADKLLTVKFTDTSNGGPTSWEWDFGDNGLSPERNQRNPQHDYADAGSYRVTLTVSNADASDTTSRLLRVGVISGFAIDASKSKGLEVAFQDTSDPVPISWSWRFGDGTRRSTLQNPVHTYAADGEYTVRLEVTTLNSGSDATSKVIAVEADLPKPPIAAFDIPPAADRNGLTLIFRYKAGSGGEPTSWKWDFGDGGTSAERDPVHTFPAPDTYAVTLTVANAAGSDSVSKFVSVQ